MLRSIALTVLLSACAGGADVQLRQDELRDETVEPGPSTEAVQTTVDYVSAVCAFHAQPSCVESRAATCADGLVLAEPAVCEDLLQSTALACPGAPELLREHQAQVDACTAHLQSTTCDDAPACDSEGTPLDATGPCEAVAALLQQACQDLVDPE